MQALVISPTWSTTFYLQAAALLSIGMDNEAQEALRDGCNQDAHNFGYKLSTNPNILLVP